MAVNNPTNSQQALGVSDSVQHGNMTLANAGALRTTTTAGETALIQAYDNNTGPAYVTFVTLTAGNTPTCDLSDSVTKAGGYIYRAGGTDIPLADGGTNASLVADLGGVVYSTATAFGIVPSTSTGNQVLLSGASSMPGWSTATYPATATSSGTLLRANGTNWAPSTLTIPDTVASNDVLYASAANTLTAITSTASRFFITNSSGVPSWTNSVDVNLIIAGSASGGTRSITAQNQSNTASSNGGFIAATSGTSAGDPFYRLETGSTTWCMGSDNSVSSPSADPWTLSNNTLPGTNDVIIAYTTGEVKFPLQPCFLAYNSADDTGQTKGGYVTVDFDTEVFDQGSDFSADTFTAPVTGKYFLAATVEISAINSATRFEMIIVTTARTYNCFRINPTAALPSGSSAIAFSGSVIADMTAGDTAIVQVIVDGGAAGYTIEGAATLVTYFSGHLVC